MHILNSHPRGFCRSWDPQQLVPVVTSHTLLWVRRLMPHSNPNKEPITFLSTSTNKVDLVIVLSYDTHIKD